MVQDQWREIAEGLRPIFERHTERVRRAIVFGSLARGDATRHSDLDLIVVEETDKRSLRLRSGQVLDRYDGFLQAVAEAARGRDVDLLIYTPQEFARMAERPFVARALREGATIYESRE